MRSLKDIKRLIQRAEIHATPEVNQAVLESLRKELAGLDKGTSVVWKASREGILGNNRMARWGLAAAAVVLVTTGLVFLHQPSRQTIPGPTRVLGTQASVQMLTEASLEAAFRRGGIEAVYDQCGRALQMERKPMNPSVQQLLAESFDNDKNAGGENP